MAPGDLVNDVSRVQIYNGLVPSGFAQIGTRAALVLWGSIEAGALRGGIGQVSAV